MLLSSLCLRQTGYHFKYWAGLDTQLMRSSCHYPYPLHHVLFSFTESKGEEDWEGQTSSSSSTTSNNFEGVGKRRQSDPILITIKAFRPIF